MRDEIDVEAGTTAATSRGMDRREIGVSGHRLRRLPDSQRQGAVCHRRRRRLRGVTPVRAHMIRVPVVARARTRALASSSEEESGPGIQVVPAPVSSGLRTHQL